MDTTYFGRKWGVMVLYDAISKRALSVLEVKNETIERYRQEVAALQERDVVIQSIICDGKSGLLGSFLDILVQMCQFHQIKIIVRHLTRKPKSPAAQALRALLTLTESTQAAFGSGTQVLVRAVCRLPERTQCERENKPLTLHA